MIDQSKSRGPAQPMFRKATHVHRTISSERLSGLQEDLKGAVGPRSLGNVCRNLPSGLWPPMASSPLVPQIPNASQSSPSLFPKELRRASCLLFRLETPHNTEYPGSHHLLLSSFSHSAHPASSPPLLKHAWFIPALGNARLPNTTMAASFCPSGLHATAPPHTALPDHLAAVMSHAIVFSSHMCPQMWSPNAVFIWPTILSLLTESTLSGAPLPGLSIVLATKKGVS